VTVNVLLSSREISVQLMRLSAEQECVDKFTLGHEKLTIRSRPESRGDTHDEADSRFGNSLP
jgi:hypothetical protein